ncbi:ATP-binding protein [bacterium]|nr:ATP-binding protein [bacterium]
MLLQASFKNFYSYQDEAILTMVATSDKTLLDQNTIPLNGSEKRVLRNINIYGANGSGKSNLFKVFYYAKIFLLNAIKNIGSDYKIPTKPFLLSTESENQSSEFEFIFIQDSTQYRYGFEVSTEKIFHEWLYAAYSKKETMLFERNYQEFKLGAKFKEGDNLTDKVTEKVPFISVVAQFNGEIAKSVIKWFSSIRIMGERCEKFNTSIIINESKKRNHLKEDLIKQLVKKSDFGIVDIQVKDDLVSGKELLKTKQEELPPRLVEDLMKQENIHLLVEKTGHYKYNKDRTSKEVVYFLLEDESTGTRKFYNLAGPLIETLIEGGIIFIDEIDRSFHTELVLELINLFNNPAINKNNAQFITTTQNQALLKEKSILRRDQFWFVEKDKYGRSSLFSLGSFPAVRKDDSWDKEYSHGRYGGVPIIHNLSQEMEYIITNQNESK